MNKMATPAKNGPKGTAVFKVACFVTSRYVPKNPPQINAVKRSRTVLIGPKSIPKGIIILTSPKPMPRPEVINQRINSKLEPRAAPLSAWKMPIIGRATASSFRNPLAVVGESDVVSEREIKGKALAMIISKTSPVRIKINRSGRSMVRRSMRNSTINKAMTRNNSKKIKGCRREMIAERANKAAATAPDISTNGYCRDILV